MFLFLKGTEYMNRNYLNRNIILSIIVHINSKSLNIMIIKKYLAEFN